MFNGTVMADWVPLCRKGGHVTGSRIRKGAWESARVSAAMFHINRIILVRLYDIAIPLDRIEGPRSSNRLGLLLACHSYANMRKGAMPLMNCDIGAPSILCN